MFEEYTKSFYMDFDGQRRAEYFFERIIVLSSLIGLVIGYIYQQFSLAIISLAVGFVLSVLISIPPWPVYRRHPLKWQKHNPMLFADEYYVDQTKETPAPSQNQNANKKTSKK